MNSNIDLPPWINSEASRSLPEICARGEGQDAEFKVRLPEQGHDIGKALAAFASTNSGRLIYGVADDGTIVGLPEAVDAKERDRIAQKVMGAAREVRPPVHPTVAWAWHDGRVVCVIGVDKGLEAVYYSNHRPMIRRGSTSRPAEPGEVEQIFRLRYTNGSKGPILPGLSEFLCVRRSETFPRRRSALATNRATRWESRWSSYAADLVNRSA